MTRGVLIAVVCTLLTAAAPAAAQDGVTLIPPSAAGQVEVPVGEQAKPFGAKAAARSARRALRRHGYEEATATCTRSARRAASCTVSAVAGGAWTGTADVTRGKRVDRVLYELVGS
jgi:hypothetical protein